MAIKVGGRARVYINGVQFPVKSDVTIMSGTTQRVSQVGLDGYHGVTETPAVSWAEFTLSDMPDIDINTIQDLTDATVSIQLDNGKQAVLRNAAQVKAIELAQADGQYGVKFESPSCTWVR